MAIVLVAACAMLTALPALARADGQITEFGVAFSSQAAGAHPDTTVHLRFATGLFPQPGPPFADLDRPYPLQLAKRLSVDLPPGIVGNPSAFPTCTDDRLLSGTSSGGGGSPSQGGCTDASQVGVLRVTTAAMFSDDIPYTFDTPIFNMAPGPNKVARLAAQVTGAVILHFDVRLRDASDYGVSVDVSGIPSAIAFYQADVTLWGVPGDTSHDDQRAACFDNVAFVCSAPGVGSQPFMLNPTRCDTGGTASVRAEFYDHPGVLSTASAPVAPFTGCDALPFDPSMAVSLDSTTPDSPTGLTVDLPFGQGGLTDPNGVASSALRNAKVTLPEGMSINASAADGLTACTDAQMGFGNDNAVRCPNASQIGWTWATSPLINGRLGGGIYVGNQLSRNPESGQMFRIFMLLENPDLGLRIKLLGSIRVDSTTGRLEATFQNNPQVPVSSIRVQFKGGPRAPLATPPDCGDKQFVGQLESWSGQTKYVAGNVSFRCPGIQGFAPSFSAGSLDAGGGAFAPFSVQINRADGQQYLQEVKVELPTGLLAKLDGVPLCGDGDATVGSCDQSSRVGDAIVGAGAGTSPFYLTGGAYLTGPYKGAPFGLAVMVPAVAGPFDLGKVVVRQQILVDPNDAHITIVSDPLPQIVGGVPVRLKSVNVDVNRPGFMINPTDCSEKQIKATLGSANGTSVELTQRFQVSGCADLPLAPELALTLSDPTQTTDGTHPGLQAVVTQTPGQANLKKAQVSLPLSMALDPDNAQALCKPEEAQAKACPDGSIVGHAVAWTPVLHEPLEGNVYFVEGLRTTATGQIRKTLPKLWVALRGAVALDVWADSDVDAKERLVNTFASVPDAPISRFELNIDGGAHGILVLNTDICRAKQVAEDVFDGQNGKRAAGNVAMTTPCPITAASSKPKPKPKGKGKSKANKRNAKRRVVAPGGPRWRSTDEARPGR
jgi:hypothetical protein